MYEPTPDPVGTPVPVADSLVELLPTPDAQLGDPDSVSSLPTSTLAGGSADDSMPGGVAAR